MTEIKEINTDNVIIALSSKFITEIKNTLQFLGLKNMYAIKESEYRMIRCEAPETSAENQYELYNLYNIYMNEHNMYNYEDAHIGLKKILYSQQSNLIY